MEHDLSFTAYHNKNNMTHMTRVRTKEKHGIPKPSFFTFWDAENLQIAFFSAIIVSHMYNKNCNPLF
jgi:hypothetical protein